MSASLALQKALRAAFIAHPDVVALVAPDAIIDSHNRPAPSPSVIIGEVFATSISGGDVGRDRLELWADVQVWKAETSTVGVKIIMGALARALRLDPRPVLEAGLHLADWQVVRERVLREPDGETVRGVLTVRALIGGLS